MVEIMFLFYAFLKAFARRGLAKINELNKLESLSNSVDTAGSAESFRQATVKVCVLIL